MATAQEPQSKPTGLRPSMDMALLGLVHTSSFVFSVFWLGTRRDGSNPAK
jgi:hypothetical protein